MVKKILGLFFTQNKNKFIFSSVFSRLGELANETIEKEKLKIVNTTDASNRLIKNNFI